MLAQTNNFNPVLCTMSIYVCITLYACSKTIIYLFLMERIYVVTAVSTTRSNFLLYKINLSLLVPYLGIFILMIIYRVSEMGPNGECRIGLLPPASMTLLLYEILISIWLTILFIRPLMSSASMLQGPSKGRLRDVARRTLVGSIMSLILSTSNVITFVLSQGQERSMICLAYCTVDVTLNAMTVHWVTSRSAGRGTGAAADKPMGSKHNIKSRINSQKQVAPSDTHVSITVESYVEQYHQQTSTGSNISSDSSTR
ncbi:hypothetical protein BGZ51_007832 [Haplosporangium sp. Z 767]|nr:hypothetical protein BGZ51_007832 [Haplosporangium sp. Z 767]KAF9194404.1 hypothetical protein BGZ50_006320 [Haplosporangium sp. Z 11]